MEGEFPASLLNAANQGVPLDEDAKDHLRKEFQVFKAKPQRSFASVILFSEFVAHRLVEIRNGNAPLLP